jgi:hypothetical protein
VHGGLRGSCVPEGSAREIDRCRWAVGAPVDVEPGRPAPPAPRWGHRLERAPARRAEGPRAAGAARAPWREDGIEGTAEHPATLRPGADITGARPPPRGRP